MATILTDFEKHVEPHIRSSPSATEGIRRFKGSTRAKLNALAVDAIDVYERSERGMQINAAAQELKDNL